MPIHLRRSPGPGGRGLVDRLEPRCLFAAITFAEPAYYEAGIGTPPGNGGEHVAVGDFNSDGVADLLVVGDDVTVTPVEQHYARVLLGRGDGSFGPAERALAVGLHVSDVAVADFDADGRLDAVVSEDRADGVVTVLLGNGDGTLRRGGTFHSGARSESVAVADFNQDGRLDLAVANAVEWSPWGSLVPAFHAAALLLGNGDGTFQSERVIHTGGRPQHFVEAGDVNGDGAVDVVFAQVVIGPGDFAAPESRVFASIGFMDVPARPPVTVPAAVTGLRLADLNGDGRLDAAVSGMRDFLGNNAVAATLTGLGDGRFEAAKLYDLPTVYASDIVVADLNADGRADLAVAGDDPRWGRPAPVPAVHTLENVGGGAFGAAQIVPLPGDFALPGRLAAGLLNRDRLPDLAVALPGSNRVGVLVNKTPAIFATAARVRFAPLSVAARPLVRFTVTGIEGAAGSPTADLFRATINWGDGTRPVAGTVVSNGDGSFGVVGSHTYLRGRVYRVTVTIATPGEGVVKTVAMIFRVTGR